MSHPLRARRCRPIRHVLALVAAAALSTPAAGEWSGAAAWSRPTSDDSATRLRQTGTGEPLDLRSEALAGGAGDALATSDASNHGDRVRVVSLAAGGSEGRAGGDATASSRGTTRGDGAGVEVGCQYPYIHSSFVDTSYPCFISPRVALPHESVIIPRTGVESGGGAGVPIPVFGAHGGSVGDENGLTAGTGGDARSSSSGIAQGDSRVVVSDFAMGGHAPAAGGDAASRARARGRGSELVRASALALGGSVTGALGTRAGDAQARAQASGRGVVIAQATAESGTFAPASQFGRRGLVWSNGGASVPGGSALAHSRAWGRSGEARAEATAHGRNGTWVSAGLVDEVAESASAWAQAAIAHRLPELAPRRLGHAFVVGDPPRDEAAAGLERAGIDASLADSEVLALGRLQLVRSGPTGGTSTALAFASYEGAERSVLPFSNRRIIYPIRRATLSLTLAPGNEVSGGGSAVPTPVRVVFYAAQLRGSGPERISLRVKAGDAETLERVFHQHGEALDFFASEWIELPDAFPVQIELEADLAEAGDGLTLGFLIARSPS